MSEGFERLSRIGTPECRIFAERIFCRHRLVDGYLKTFYIRETRARGYKYANNQLRLVDEMLKAPGTVFSVSMDDQEIRDLAVIRAKQMEGRVKAAGGSDDIKTIAFELRDVVEVFGVEFPMTLSKKDLLCESRIAEKCIKAMTRVCCERWWRRRLRVVYSRTTEQVLRYMGFVRRGKSAYVSKWSLKRWQISQARSKAVLERLSVVNEEEEEVKLSDCVKSSISNPVNRRNELMVRIRGYEEVAAGMNLEGLFFTLTAPGSYHPQLSRGGRNTKYNGATPRDAMDYLNGVWSRIRAEWARSGVKVFGFRVCEPHHDGTPHFHLLLFVRPEQVNFCVDVFGRHALKVDPEEPGALKNRFDVKKMKPEAGGASAYIAKYISKNIDGHGVDLDYESDSESGDSSVGVRAWASTWGIRQFQQIGSVSVTVWRELRRQPGIFEEEIPDIAEDLRAAADKGDWAEFVELMGGAFSSRDELSARPMYIENTVKPNSYGEQVKKLIGLWLKPVANMIKRCYVPTRHHVWEIRESSDLGSTGKTGPPSAAKWQPKAA